jgi:hypothetical protein
MNKTKSLLRILAALMLSAMASSAQQTPYLYRIALKGTSYQTNAPGTTFVPIPLSEQVLLADVAQAGGVDPSTLALVYHIQNSGLGDTIDVVNRTDGSTLVNLFGLYFGDDNSLGRTAATNSAITEIKRLDYVYTLNNYTYTSWNSHSMGACFTTKRLQGDALGNTHALIDGQMQWIVNPQNGAGTRICVATFTTTKPFVPGQ